MKQPKQLKTIKFRPIDDCLKEDKKTIIISWILAPVITALSWGLLIYLSSL